jgi:predicted PurR-regulated permease PerM
MFEVSASPSHPHLERPPPPLESPHRRSRLVALGIVLLGSFLAVAHLVAPLWIGIAFGTVMAFTAQPLFRFLCARLHGRRKLASALTTAFSGAAFCAVGSAIAYVLTREAMSVASVLRRKIELGSLEGLIGRRAAEIVDALGLSRQTVMSGITNKVSIAADDLGRVAGVLLQTTGAMIIGLLIGLMTMYYVLIEWVNLAVRLERVLPLDPKHTRLLLLELRDVSRTAMVGSIATATIQAVLGGVAYGLAGVPHPVTFAMLTFVGSFLPAIGTGLVWIPLGLYLLFSGHVLAGVLLMVWCALAVVGVSDYFIRPRLVRKEEHPLLTLVALLGGLEVFGLAGLLVGPILMSLFIAILRIYEREQLVS